MLRSALKRLTRQSRDSPLPLLLIHLDFFLFNGYGNGQWGVCNVKRKYLRRFDGLVAPPAFRLDPGRSCIYFYVSHLWQSRRSLLRSAFLLGAQPQIRLLMVSRTWKKRAACERSPHLTAGVCGAFWVGNSRQFEALITGKRFVNRQPATGFLIDITTHWPSNSFHVQTRIHQP